MGLRTNVSLNGRGAVLQGTELPGGRWRIRCQGVTVTVAAEHLQWRGRQDRPFTERGWLPILGESSVCRTGGEGLQDQDLDRQRLQASRRRREVKRSAEEAFAVELVRQQQLVAQRWRGVSSEEGLSNQRGQRPEPQGSLPSRAA